MWASIECGAESEGDLRAAFNICLMDVCGVRRCQWTSSLAPSPGAHTVLFKVHGPMSLRKVMPTRSSYIGTSLIEGISCSWQ
ncbi:hypothetical protein GCK32_019957 [Trichostrongylus colubriformis]|uniref:Uncharacterized protein n=1 Tax=Trichostrongylus colubriformis TaxID=6319 RepID=A0AAN8G7F5_TRICO